MKFLISLGLLLSFSFVNAETESLVESLRQGGYKIQMNRVRLGFGYDGGKVCSDLNSDNECVNPRFVFVAQKKLGIEPYFFSFQSSADQDDQFRTQANCMMEVVTEKATFEQDVRKIGVFSETTKFRYVYAMDPNQEEWPQYRKLLPQFLYFNLYPEYHVAFVDPASVREVKEATYKTCWQEEYDPGQGECREYHHSRRVSFDAFITTNVKIHVDCHSAVADKTMRPYDFTVDLFNVLVRSEYVLTK